MSGDRYHISDQHAPYFITWNIIHWIDLFSRQCYRDIVVESLNYCIRHRGVNIYAWIIMSNHVHLVARVDPPGGMSAFIRDCKKFTSKKFIVEINETNESRREWLLDKFQFEARRSRRADNYKVWKDDNHAIDLSHIDMMEKINYIHENPVRAGLVDYPDQYLYSSARDYAGHKGLVDVIII